MDTLHTVLRGEVLEAGTREFGKRDGTKGTSAALKVRLDGRERWDRVEGDPGLASIPVGTVVDMDCVVRPQARATDTGLSKFLTVYVKAARVAVPATP